MRLLFVKHALAWPRSSGHDVYCFQMMQALGQLGHQIGLVTVVEPVSDALEGLTLSLRCSIGSVPAAASNGHPRLTPLQDRFREFYGVEARQLTALRQAAKDWRAHAVVAAGLNAPIYLGALQGVVRIWYAADEWILHHLTQVRFSRHQAWENVREAIVKGVYERVFARSIDRVWVVSESERRAMRWFAGMGVVDVLPYGVDNCYFRPMAEEEIANSAVFWGRLDFGPNIQALEWFCRRVWPAVRQQMPDARFTILGFRPSEAVSKLAGSDGVTLLADLPDIRREISRHALVVLPFVSGGGIKNKLLEAAGLGKAIVSSRRALGGLCRSNSLPVIEAGRPADWVRKILLVWADEDRRRQLGAAARAWVLDHHSWLRAARDAAAGLQESSQGRTPA